MTETMKSPVFYQENIEDTQTLSLQNLPSFVFDITFLLAMSFSETHEFYVPVDDTLKSPEPNLRSGQWLEPV